jgi:hypothetical protein
MIKNKLFVLIIISIILFVLFPLNITLTSLNIWFFYIIDYLAYIIFWLIPIIFFFKKRLSNKYYILLIIFNILIFVFLWYLWEKKWLENQNNTLDRIKMIEEIENQNK